MYSQSRGMEVRFDIRMRAERTMRGMPHYNRICGKPKFDYDDPLDMAFPEILLPVRAKRQRKATDLTPEEFRDARGRLGHMWGMGRPLTLTEFGRVLRLGGVRPDQSVRDYERGKTPISGPLSLLIELMLKGAQPPHGLS